MDASFAIPDNTTYNASTLPKAVDLSHHLNLLARSRKANTLKSLYQYAGRPGMIALAGGMPPPEFFPFETLEAEIMTFDSKPKTTSLAATASAKESKASSSSLFSWLFNKPTTKPAKTQHISVPKFNTGVPGTVDLASLLQYSSAQGNPALLAFIKEFSAKAYGPAYADWEVLLNIGATQGWNMVVNLLCERGDPILVEEFTYPGAMNSYVPLGCPKIPIEMDGEGIIPASLEKILAEWDVEARGMKRPTVFYTIPTGQNPTGATMLAKRKKEVYEILVKYDVICVEDDPYFWLGGAPWIPQAGKKSAEATLAAQASQDGLSEVDRFIASVAPSYLKFDYQGRVIRLDTFSKTIAPGSRLGWFTCSPIFAERLLRATESSAQAPSGYGQAMVTTLLNTWKFDGYIRWLQGVQSTYSMRRDWMCDLFEEIFHLEFEKSLRIGGSKFIGVEAYERAGPGRGASLMDEKRGFKSKKALLSFVPPSAGMFLWIKIEPENFSAYHSLCAADDPEPEVTFIQALWKELADQNVLVSPGSFFDGRTDVPAPVKGGDTAGYFRLSFSIATHDQQRVAIQTFHDILANWAK